MRKRLHLPSCCCWSASVSRCSRVPCCCPHSASSRAPVANPVLQQGARRRARAGATAPPTRRCSPRASCTRCSTRPGRFGAAPPAPASTRRRRDRGHRGLPQSSSRAADRRTAASPRTALSAHRRARTIAVNPLDPANILVGQNDSRIGFNHCGYAWTLDGGSHWGDQTPPFFQVPLLDQKPAEACANPTVTWDSQGNAYVAGDDLRRRRPRQRRRRGEVERGDPRRVLPFAGLGSGFQEYSALPLGVVDERRPSSSTTSR